MDQYIVLKVQNLKLIEKPFMKYAYS